MITVSERAIAKERARERAFPESWMTRLREVSPVGTGTSYLVPRWRGEYEVWMLYQAIPDHRIDPERRTQLATYWQDLAVNLQGGRRTMVSDYQYRMYHDFRVDARPFLVLQGDQGGTPARYTNRERQILQAMQLPDKPPPLGSLPYAPFDERVVHRIIARDRLVRVSQNLDALAKMDSVLGQKAIEAEANRAHRQAFLDYWHEQMGPIADRLGSILRNTHEGKMLRRATQAEAYAANHFHDHFLETGEVPNAGLPDVVRG